MIYYSYIFGNYNYNTLVILKFNLIKKFIFIFNQKSNYFKLKKLNFLLYYCFSINENLFNYFKLFIILSTKYKILKFLFNLNKIE